MARKAPGTSSRYGRSTLGPSWRRIAKRMETTVASTGHLTIEKIRARVPTRLSPIASARGPVRRPRERQGEPSMRNAVSATWRGSVFQNGRVSDTS